LCTGDGRLLLADGHVEAVNALALLIDDRVDRDGGLAGAAVADDQLALAAADRDHRVDGLQAGRQGLLDRLARRHAGRLQLDVTGLRGGHGAFAVERLAHGVQHAADDAVAHGHRGDGAGALDRVAFLDLGVRAHDGDTDGILFEVQHDAEDIPGELDHLAGHDVLQTVHARDTIAHLQDRADTLHAEVAVVVLQLLRQDRADLFRPQFHFRSPR
jgi:hypothetical protein